MVKRDWGNPLRNQIYETSLRTLHLCMHTHYEDSPWREQALYAMDSRNQMLCGYYGFQEYTFPRANLYLFGQDPREDNLLSICTPTDRDLTIPSFSLHYILAVHEYTAYSKDMSLFQSLMPKLQAMMDAFLQRYQDGLYRNFSGRTYWRFYEWMEGLSGDLYGDENVPVDAAHNCLLSIALGKMQELCDWNGVEANYGCLASQLNKRIKEVFYNKDRGLIQTYTDDSHFGELVNAWAILAGVVEGEEADVIAAKLADGFDVSTTLSMTCFKYDALLKVDKERYREYVLNDLDRTYGYMLDKGATSFWETIDSFGFDQSAQSLCHGWSALPVYYYHLLLSF